MRRDKKEPSHAPRPAADLFGFEPRVELKGSREVMVEGSTGVIFYSDTVIRTGIGRQTLLITGSELRIKVMFGSTLTVGGHICSVEFV